MSDHEILADIVFEGDIIEWRGPAPFLFVPVPDHHVAEIKYAARHASYGWGVVPVEATINGIAFTTSLFPRGETYYLPVKVVVQRAANVTLGDRVAAAIRIIATM